MPRKIRMEPRYRLIILVCLLALIPVANMLNKAPTVVPEAPTVVPVVQYDIKPNINYSFLHDQYSYFLTINQPEDTCPSVYGHDWWLDISLSHAYIKMRALVNDLRNLDEVGGSLRCGKGSRWNASECNTSKNPFNFHKSAAELRESYLFLMMYSCV
jgi:hypothetical protein